MINPLEIEDKINTTLVINWSLKYKNSVEPGDGMCIKGCRFLSFAKNKGKTFVKTKVKI